MQLAIPYKRFKLMPKLSIKLSYKSSRKTQHYKARGSPIKSRYHNLTVSSTLLP